VSWLFEGEIEHRDSAGHHAMVRPGEVNLMTAGRGISHSEVSTPEAQRLHGAQLWVALPEVARHGEPGFVHHAPEPVSGPGWTARVFIGSLLGQTSPVPSATPLLGAELLLDSHTSLTLDIDPGFEHGVLVDEGAVDVDGDELKEHLLGYRAPGPAQLTLTSYDAPARLLLLGGEPLGEQIVMWWNFVGRTHEEVEAYRRDWQAQITRNGAVVEDSQEVTPGRFGVVPDDHLPPIPAPELPQVRLKPRR
jgi:redox-sensitive bicupin YhaK (pirin superfamily)